MTIRYQIRIGLALILAVFVGLSAFAIDRIGVMARHWGGLTETVIPTLTLSGEMSVLLDKLRLVEAYHTLEKDPDRARAQRVEIEKLQARIYMLIAEYKELASDPEQAAVLDALSADLRRYVVAFEKGHNPETGDDTEDAIAQLRTRAP